MGPSDNSMSLLPQKTNSSTGSGMGARSRRSTSESSTTSSPRKWTWGNGRPWKSSSKHGQDKDSSKQPHLALDPGVFPGTLPTPDLSISISNEGNNQQLREYVQKMRSAPSDSNRVDDAHKTYSKIKDKAMALCEALLTPRSRCRESSALLSQLSNAGSGRDSPFDAPSLQAFETRSSVSSRSLTEQGHPSLLVSEQFLSSIRDWKKCLESLIETFAKSLLETYKEYEQDATDFMVEQLFTDKAFRRTAIQRMRNASISKMMSANLDFFPKYEIRFRNHDKVKADLIELRQLLQTGESGISPDRTIVEIAISSRGDAILEFANTAAESYPVFRFRVSSHMLAETSPIFASMFRPESARVSSEDATTSMPPAPTRYICKDGSEAKLYRMPQLELNVEKSLETLLHAAHMHHDHEQVPRDIDFDRFVAIAEVCMRYKCTSPLELFVEHRWLPLWMHKAIDNMPDGLLLISYAFGLRRLFTRMSKTAILNVIDEKDLQSKSWPQKIKDKVWAVRTAKMAQVFTCCSNALQEYLRQPPPTQTNGEDASKPAAELMPCFKPTTTSLCPKGSHFCDAANLGWLMMVFAELQLLPYIMRSAAISHLPSPPTRSINQLVDSLRLVESPPDPQAHRGVCDFAPAFRGNINDIYNSIVGLTLFDVSGEHGWALSKHKVDLSKSVFKVDAPMPDLGAAKRSKEEVALKIMGHLDTMEDLLAAAMINNYWYQTYKKHQLGLMRGLIRRTSSMEVKRWTVSRAKNMREARDELKALEDEIKLRRSEARSRAKVKEGTAGPVKNARRASGLRDTEDDDNVSDDDSDSSDGPIEIETMTREEASRYLWPGNETSPDSQSRPSAPKPVYGEDGSRFEGAEKFRACDAPPIEDKTLVGPEYKHLRDEHDWKNGLLMRKDDDDDEGP